MVAWLLLSDRRLAIGDSNRWITGRRTTLMELKMWNKLKYSLAIFGGPLYLVIDAILNKNMLGHALVMILFIILAVPIWPFFCEAWRGKPLDIDLSPILEKISEADALGIADLVAKSKTLDAVRLVRKLLPGTGIYKARLIALKMHTRSLNLSELR